MFCHRCASETQPGATFCYSCGAPLESTARESSAQVDTPGVSERYAGFWYRVLAYLIDWLLSTVLVIVLVAPVGFAIGASMAGSASADDIENVAGTFGKIASFIIVWLWFTISESSSWQATVGKKLLGLKVTDEAGGRISFGRANGRYWSKIISAVIAGIGFLMVAFTERKQGLHDKIAGTLVVKSSN